MIPPQIPVFPTTRWTQVARAAHPSDPAAHAALSALCEAYWYPVYAFIRRNGHDPDQALDLTQAYFARVLERRTIAAADRERGRFRAFLRTDCRFFLADMHDHAQARKRGGGVTIASLDAADAESRYTREPIDRDTPDRAFDRAWALLLLDQARAVLAGYYAATHREGLFQVLQPMLAPGGETASQAEIAGALGMTPGALQVALYRMRARYGQIIREKIAATLDQPARDQLDQEIRGLFAALGR